MTGYKQQKQQLDILRNRRLTSKFSKVVIFISKIQIQHFDCELRQNKCSKFYFFTFTHSFMNAFVSSLSKLSGTKSDPGM